MICVKRTTDSRRLSVEAVNSSCSVFLSAILEFSSLLAAMLDFSSPLGIMRYGCEVGSLVDGTLRINVAKMISYVKEIVL